MMKEVVQHTSSFPGVDSRHNAIHCLSEPSSDSNYQNENTSCKNVSKRLSKKISSCGSNFQAALLLLYETYPQLKESTSPNNGIQCNHLEISRDPESLSAMDARVISSTIDLLRRAKQPKAAFELLDRLLNIHRRSKFQPSEHSVIDYSNDFNLSMIFKAIINMIGYVSTEINPSRILEILHDEIPKHTDSPPPLDIYHATINALGRCKRMDLVHVLLRDMEISRTNTVEENSCGVLQKPWNYTLPTPDRLAYMTAITASIRSKEPHYALKYLQGMKELGISPDVVAYNQVLASLAKSGRLPKNIMIERHVLALEILNEMEDSNILSPNEATYDIVACICGKDGKWDIVSRLTEYQKNINKDDAVIAEVSLPTHVNVIRLLERGSGSFKTTDSAVRPYNMDLEPIEKIGRGRTAWYKIGHYKNVSENSIAFGFGIQMHRNPQQNGLSVVFYEESSSKKLGYMLLRNQIISAGDISQPQIFATDTDGIKTLQHYSSLVGMYITENQRGKGLASIFIAVWLRLCLNTKALPRSEKINKPLLSLVMSKFGFKPDDSSGIDVEVGPISHFKIMSEKDRISRWKPVFAIYSPSLHPLDRSFGQKMMISKDPPFPRGKVTTVKTTFTHPITQLAIRQIEEKKKRDLEMLLDLRAVKKRLEDKVEQVLRGENECGKLEFEISDDTLNLALFGFCL